MQTMIAMANWERTHPDETEWGIIDGRLDKIVWRCPLVGSRHQYIHMTKATEYQCFISFHIYTLGPVWKNTYRCLKCKFVHYVVVVALLFRQVFCLATTFYNQMFVIRFQEEGMHNDMEHVTILPQIPRLSYQIAKTVSLFSVWPKSAGLISHVTILIQRHLNHISHGCLIVRSITGVISIV